MYNFKKEFIYMQRGVHRGSSSADINPKSYHLTDFELINQCLTFIFQALNSVSFGKM